MKYWHKLSFKYSAVLPMVLQRLPTQTCSNCHADAMQACGEVAVMFQSDPTCVQAAQSSSHPLVREKATAW